MISAVQTFTKKYLINNFNFYHFPPIFKESSQKYPFLHALAFHNTLNRWFFVLSQPQQRQTKRGRLRTMYIHILLEDIRFVTTGELRMTMLDQSGWWGRIHAVQASVQQN